MARHGTGEVILALDQGTSSSRALVVDRRGAIRSVAQLELARTWPRPGWVEQDAAEIWRTQHHVAREALSRAGVTATDVAAIGITNQRETTVVWDRATSQPIAPAIVWQDRRTAADCKRLREAGHETLIRRRTGLVIDPYFSATKIGWLLDHVSGARARAEAGELAFGTVDTWLAWCLSGGRRHITDATNASRTLLYDIHRGQWDADLLALFGVPSALLPEIHDTSAVVAHADVDGLRGPPIAALVGDQQGALFGQACVAPGMAKATYGTGCFLLMHTGDKPAVSEHGLLTTVALQRGGQRQYALEGSVFTAGAAVQWLRDGLHLIDAYDELDGLAGSAPSSEGVFFVPALAGLGAPHWDAGARGAFFGLTSGTTTGHLARAALEGICLQVNDLLKAVVSDTGLRPPDLRVDGGAAANDLLMQIQADVLDLPVTRAASREATAMGAAALAGLALGLWETPPMHAAWRAERRFVPQPGFERDALLAGWSAAVASTRAFGTSQA